MSRQLVAPPRRATPRHATLLLLTPRQERRSVVSTNISTVSPMKSEKINQQIMYLLPCVCVTPGDPLARGPAGTPQQQQQQQQQQTRRLRLQNIETRAGERNVHTAHLS